MLIVGREIGQSVIIDGVIKVTVQNVRSKLRLDIDAPKGIRISKVPNDEGNRDFLKKGTRIIDSSILIGENIKVTILETESGLLRFAIDAPKEVSIFREELYKKNQIPLIKK
ncbi:carbon storage regulator [Neobacillus drentensis]|uniref:carbon storage regulator n=1 Tax=Neobacillus drentensis TaxID=220684 RepID=UPI0030039370